MQLIQCSGWEQAKRLRGLAVGELASQSQQRRRELEWCPDRSCHWMGRPAGLERIDSFAFLLGHIGPAVVITTVHVCSRTGAIPITGNAGLVPFVA
jgi:hypothetical protein